MSEIDLIGKRVVIALGGNALGTTPKELTKKVQATAHQIALMVKEGINVVVTHGNGPQVGIIDEAFSIASKEILFISHRRDNLMELSTTSEIILNIFQSKKKEHSRLTFCLRAIYGTLFKEFR